MRRDFPFFLFTIAYRFSVITVALYEDNESHGAMIYDSRVAAGILYLLLSNSTYRRTVTPGWLTPESVRNPDRSTALYKGGSTVR